MIIVLPLKRFVSKKIIIKNHTDIITYIHVIKNIQKRTDKPASANNKSTL